MITGKEALIALANDIDVEYLDENLNEWVCMDMAHHFKRKFRLKPRTITINGIEVPAPFEPKEGDVYWYLTDAFVCGYEKYTNNILVPISIGAWRTEEEIKQVVAALRSAFNVK